MKLAVSLGGTETLIHRIRALDDAFGISVARELREEIGI
jgi:hypothetical protein